MEKSFPEVETSPEKTGAKEEIRFLLQETDAPSVAAYVSMEGEFEAEFPQYDVIIEFTNPEAVGPKITTIIASGGVLDVFQPYPELAVQMAKDKNLLPIDDVVENLGGKDQFFANTLLEYDGETVCMPYAAAAPVLWYRTDVFDRLGLKPPTNWEETEEAARVISEDGEMAGIALPAGENNYTAIMLINQLYSGGTQVFDKDGNLQLEGNERAAAALQHYANLLKSATEGAASYSYFESIDAFTSGKAAMVIYWGRVLGRVYDSTPDLIGKVGAVPLPMGLMQAVESEASWNCIYSKTEHADASKAWVEFMARPEQAVKLQLTVAGHMVPVTQGQKEAFLASDLPIVKDNLEIMEVLFGFPAYSVFTGLDMGAIDEENLKIVETNIINPYMAIVFSNGALARAIQNVYLNDMDPMDALAQAQTELEPLLK